MTSSTTEVGVLQDPTPDRTLSTDSISIKLPSPKWSFTTTVIVMIFWGLVIYLVAQTAMLYLDNPAIIKWWQDGTGVDKTYNQHFSIWLTLCAGQRSLLLYGVMSLFLPQTVQMTIAQKIFITGTLFKSIRYVQNGLQYGIMLPKHLCETVLLSYNDKDDKFNAWYDANKATRIADPGDPNNPLYYLKFTSSQVPQGKNPGVTLTTYKPIYIDDKTPKYGIYPSPQRLNVEDWKGCIQAWMNGGLGSSEQKWAWGPSKDPNLSILLPMTYGDDVNGSANLTHWFDIEKQPDNVFARYGLKATSPLILYWVNQKSSYDSLQVDTTAFQNLIYGSPAGGWIGFLSGMGQAASADNFQDECFAEANTQQVTPPPPSCSPSAKWGGAALGGGIAGLGMMSMLAMPGVNVIALTAFAVLLTAGTVAQKAMSTSC